MNFYQTLGHVFHLIFKELKQMETRGEKKKKRKINIR